MFEETDFLILEVAFQIKFGSKSNGAVIHHKGLGHQQLWTEDDRDANVMSIPGLNNNPPSPMKPKLSTT